MHICYLSKTSGRIVLNPQKGRPSIQFKINMQIIIIFRQEAYMGLVGMSQLI